MRCESIIECVDDDVIADSGSGASRPSGSSLPASGHSLSESVAIPAAEHAACPAAELRVLDGTSDGDSASEACNDACDGAIVESCGQRAEANKTGEATGSSTSKQTEAIAEGPSTVSKRKRGRPRKPETGKTKKQAKCCNHSSAVTISAADATVPDVCAAAAGTNGEDPESLDG